MSTSAPRRRRRLGDANRSNAAIDKRMEAVHVRRAVAEDWPFILALIPRLTNFAPQWRDRASMAGAETHAVEESLNSGDPDRAVFVAEDGTERLGFVELWT